MPTLLPRLALRRLEGAAVPRLRRARSAMAQGARSPGGPARRPASVLGTMEFGRRTEQEASGALLRAFLERGHRELDTAHMYGGGASERILGALLAGGGGPAGEVRLFKLRDPSGRRGRKAKYYLFNKPPAAE